MLGHLNFRNVLSGGVV